MLCCVALCCVVSCCVVLCVELCRVVLCPVCCEVMSVCSQHSGAPELRGRAEQLHQLPPGELLWDLRELGAQPLCQLLWLLWSVAPACLSVPACFCVYVCVCVCVCVCTHARSPVYEYVWVRGCICMFICECACMHACVCVVCTRVRRSGAGVVEAC